MDYECKTEVKVYHSLDGNMKKYKRGKERPEGRGSWMGRAEMMWKYIPPC
jgi:hypothetical protein